VSSQREDLTGLVMSLSPTTYLGEWTEVSADISWHRIELLRNVNHVGLQIEGNRGHGWPSLTLTY
jgi:hypothetical protein